MKKIALSTFALVIITGLLVTACGPATTAPPPTQAAPQALDPNLYDLGDAPDPTYSVLLTNDGARTHDPYQFWLGPRKSVASIEADAKVVNLDEAEDGLESSLATAGKILLAIRVTNGKSSPARDVYLNGLIDSDNNGQWGNFTGPGGLVEEWFLVNKVIHLEPGDVVVVKTSAPLAFGNLKAWIRLMVSDTPVVPGSDGWTGTGFWELGEVEDYLFEPGPFETPTPTWTPTPTPTATNTPTTTPTRFIITGGENTATPTATATSTEKWIETKKGGPTDTPTPPPNCAYDPTGLWPECTTITPPPEQPVWSGYLCGGVPLFDAPYGNRIGHVRGDDHVYFYEIREDLWARVSTDSGLTGWVFANWADPNQFGYEGHPCQ